MALTIKIMDGRGLSNKARCERDKCSAILVVHFIVRDAATLMAKLGTRQSALVYYR